MSSEKLKSFISTRRKLFACMLLGLIMIITTGFTMSAFPSNMHRVSVVVDGRTIHDMTLHMDTEYILDKLGVKLGERDSYELREHGSRRATIVVKRAVPLTITYGGDKQTVMSSKATVGEVITEYGYNLAEVDVSHDVSTPVTPDMAIVLTENAAGMEARLAREREAERVSRGIPRYRTKMIMEATAYLPSDGNGDGITATGLVATYGIVAVDPRVIPLGTRVFVPGYGEAIAADTGGAIKGHKIDLCMESYYEAIQFGRRDIEVYILD